MAYLAFAETAGGPPVDVVPAAATRPVTRSTEQRPALSALEWSVVALAERDRISTLRSPSRIAVALGTLFGERANPQLADTRLEALRRIAVLSWHYGYVVPSSAIRDFLAAGFTEGQYELLVDSIGVARAKRNRKTVR